MLFPKNSMAATARCAHLCLCRRLMGSNEAGTPAEEMSWHRSTGRWAIQQWHNGMMVRHQTLPPCLKKVKHAIGKKIIPVP